MMTLVEAMRAGCDLSLPRRFDYVVEADSDAGVPFEACAMGAAAIGIGRPEMGMDSGPETFIHLFASVWPELIAVRTKCPVEPCPNFSLHVLSV